LPIQGKAGEPMAVVRGIALKPDQGVTACHAIELAFEDDDYGNAIHGRVVQAHCSHAPVGEWQGSGLCELHNAQIRLRERGRSIK
jgi:hypothetical protein